MLDNYIDKQPIVHKLLINSLNTKKDIHAYLFQTNGAIESKDIVLSFVKSLICPSHYTNLNNCNNCQICNQIDKGSFPEIKIIEPDGLWIKKEQMIDLQQKLSTKALETSQRVYVIYEAEKMNAAAANSLLKFLEEPEEGIIAILVTNDIHKMLKTITSRCQVIFLKPSMLEEKAGSYKDFSNITLVKFGLITVQRDEELEEYIGNVQNLNKIEAIVQIVNRYEKDKLDVLLHSKELWHDYFKEKSELIWAFEGLLLFYKDVLNLLCSKNIEMFNFYEEDVTKTAKNNNVAKIIDKMNKILVAKEKIKNNANANLLFDKLIISMEGGAVHDRCSGSVL